MWTITEPSENYFIIESPTEKINYYVRGNFNIEDKNEVKRTADVILKILETGKKTNSIKKLYRPDNELLMLTNKCQIGCCSSISKVRIPLSDESTDTPSNPERKEGIDLIISKIV